MNRSAPLALVLGGMLLVACGADSGSEADPVAELLPISDAEIQVGQTLRFDLAVNNPAGLSLEFDYEAPPLPGLDQVVTIGGTSAGGEFVWTPLASQVGLHDFQFILRYDGGESTQSARITVQAGSRSAPIFLAPGAGGTFDLARDPCVNFGIEVRDDDSPDVLFQPTTPLPAGAELSSTGAKSAEFSWCPSPDQVDSSLRWEVGFSADDGDHAATEHLFVIVLRAPGKEGCPGEPPVVTIVSPAKGDTVTSSNGYPVSVEVEDDIGVRDPPVLYWSTEAPDDEENPDISSFTQSFCQAAGTSWACTIPPLDLADGEERVLYVVVSATDNDDTSGTSCDNRGDSELLRFIAVGGSAPTAVPACGVCTNSAQCASGICAVAASGTFCLQACEGGEACGSGSCVDTTSAEGATRRACGPRAAACSAGPNPDECVEDEFEFNDEPATATPAADGEYAGSICEGDVDYYALALSAGTELSALLDGFVHAEGDLDLFLVGADESVIATSAGTANSESLVWCTPQASDVFVAVAGYAGSQNEYDLSIVTTPSDCCIDDEFEPDDALLDPRIVEAGDPIEGVVCPDDDDFLAFDVPSPAVVTFLLVFDSELADLDLELYDESGRVVAVSETLGDEEIEYLVEEPGIYTIRVYGYRGDSGDYLAELTIDPV